MGAGLSTYFFHQLFSHCPLQHFHDPFCVGPRRLPSEVHRVHDVGRTASMHQMTSGLTHTWLVNDRTYIGPFCYLDQMDPEIERKKIYCQDNIVQGWYHWGCRGCTLSFIGRLTAKLWNFAINRWMVW